MSFLLRLCLGLTVWVPSLAHAQLTGALEIPGNGTTVSGVGMIAGWKCEADGGHHHHTQRGRPSSRDVWVGP